MKIFFFGKKQFFKKRKQETATVIKPRKRQENTEKTPIPRYCPKPENEADRITYLKVRYMSRIIRNQGIGKGAYKDVRNRAKSPQFLY